MKQKSIKIIAVAVLVCLVIGALPFLSTQIKINATPQAIGSTTSFYPAISFPYQTYWNNDKYKGTEWKGATIMQATSPLQEVSTRDEIATAWLVETGESELITLKATFSYHFLPWEEPSNIPLNTIGGYWYVVYYTDTTGTYKIIDMQNGFWYDTNYVTIQRQPDPLLKMSNSDGYKFESVQSYYVTASTSSSCAMYNSRFATNDNGNTGLTYWNNYISGKPWLYKNNVPDTLYGSTIEFKMKGQRSGYLRVLGLCNMAERMIYTPVCVPVFGCNDPCGQWSVGNAMICEDYIKLSSGTGSVNILASSTSTVQNPNDKPEEIKDGTGTNPDNGVVDPTEPTYAERIFQEGDTVNYEVSTGYAGTTTNPWTIAIWDAKGNLIQSSVTPLANNLLRQKRTFVIPKGNFDPTIGLNEYTIVLTNGLWKQGLAYMFVVDTKARLPGASTVTTDKQQYVVGNTVSATMWALSTTASGAINKFRVEVRWDSPSGALVTGFTNPTQILAVSSGGRYQATFNFAITQANRNCYILANALAGTNSEYPGNTGQCYVSAIPLEQTLQVTIQVKDSSTQAVITGAIVHFGTLAGTTGTTGTAVFNVKANVYALKITAVGYQDYVDTLDVTMNKIYAIPINPTGGGGGGTTNVYIDVYNASSTSQQRISGASVTIDTTAKQTDSSGSILFSALTNTTHPLTVTATGYEDFSQTVAIPDDLTSGRYAVQLTPKGQSGTTFDVSIDVINSATNEFVNDATVTINDIPQSTGTTGTAEFTLPAGSYSATATKDGFESKTQSVAVADTTYAQIFVTPTGQQQGTTFTVTLTVTSEDGLAVSGATITDITQTQTVTTDATGIATLLDVVSGDHNLIISHSDYEDNYPTISVDQTTTSFPIIMTAKGTPPVNNKCTVAITVKDAKTGATIDGATVNVGGVTKTTSSGTVTVEVDAGTVSVVIAKQGYTPYNHQINFKSNAPKTFNLIPIKTPSTPGFEMFGLIVAIGIALILFKRKQVKKE